jgi:hypothetical protein
VKQTTQVLKSEHPYIYQTKGNNQQVFSSQFLELASEPVGDSKLLNFRSKPIKIVLKL